jgi:hypothetical protein
VVLVGGFLWYESRPKPPKPPKPWNTAAIKAEYDFADTEGDNNDIVVYYTMGNTTDFDYRVEKSPDVTFSAKLLRENSLSISSDADRIDRIDYPIFVPAKKRVRFPIHLRYPYSEKMKANPAPGEGEKYRKSVEKYIINEMNNLDGFDLLDETNRYEILFPAGWKDK